MESARIYRNLGEFVDNLGKCLGKEGRCALSCRQWVASRDAEGVVHSFEASCASLNVNYRIDYRVSHEDKSSDDGEYFEVFESEIKKKGLRDRITFRR